MTITGTNVILGQTARFDVGSGDPNGVNRIVVTISGAVGKSETLNASYGYVTADIPKETPFGSVQVNAQVYSDDGNARDYNHQTFYL